MTTDTPFSAAQVVREAARDGEIDRYFAALMAPATIRDDAMAIAAFAAVIGHIPHAVHEPMMGEVRLQWWRDSLLSNQFEATGHPIADAVATARHRHRLSGEPFKKMIDAVSLALDSPTAEASQEVSHALTQFEGSAFALSAHIHAGSALSGHPELFEHAGTAYGLARALCRLPIAMSSGWPPLPLIHPESEAEAQLKAVEEIQRLHATARGALADVRRAQRSAPPSAITALAPVAMVEPYLDAQSRVIESLLESPVEILPLKRIWRIWRSFRRRRL